MSRQPARRPTLLPTVRKLWRGPYRLQLGTDPARALLLELGDPVQARLLDLLDGSHTERGLIRAARSLGLTTDDAEALLRMLTTAGYVVDARTLELTRASETARRRLAGETSAMAMRTASTAAMRRRLQAKVLVTGWSRLAVPIACVLAASGVGNVDADQTGITRLADAAPAGLLPTDAHRPRGVAAAEALRRVAPDLDITPVRRTRATFAVIVGFSAPASLTALSYARRRLPHIAVSVRDGTVVVGPLVRPGVSPCLNCLDLHRADRDPDWHAVAAQLHTGPDLSEPVAATTALSAAAFAAYEALTHIDGGEPSTLGATVEISEPGQSARRQWTQHPGCGCRRRGRSRTGEPPARRS